jgi:hypothetical protein
VRCCASFPGSPTGWVRDLGLREAIRVATMVHDGRTPGGDRSQLVAPFMQALG